MPFQPILYFVLWGATVRIAVTDDNVPLAFSQVLSSEAGTLWTALGLTCPPLALLSWWLVAKSTVSRAALAGLWIRLGADVGQLTALITYHVVTVYSMPHVGTESRVYARYCVAAATLFVMALVARDMWALAATERLAIHLRRGHRE